MPPSTTFDEPPDFNVGDRVVSVDPVGPRLHRIPRGSAGVVVARTPERLIAVRFDAGRMERLMWVFDQASNLLLRALNIEPVHDVEHAATARDLEHIVEASRERGDLSAELSMTL